MKYFSLKELTNSPTAKSKGIDNTPTPEVVKNLTLIVDKVMDPLREWYGKPIRVTSGYRSPLLNRAIGGVKNSQHQKGQAIDFVCDDMAKCFEYIKNNLTYDQLIWEYGNDRSPKWIHVSYDSKSNRKQVLRIR